ncbi:MAG: hypothetical protein ACR2M7_00815 [Bdellovibrionales bacterium]
MRFLILFLSFFMIACSVDVTSYRPNRRNVSGADRQRNKPRRNHKNHSEVTKGSTPEDQVAEPPKREATEDELAEVVREKPAEDQIAEVPKEEATEDQLAEVVKEKPKKDPVAETPKEKSKEDQLIDDLNEQLTKLENFVFPIQVSEEASKVLVHSSKERTHVMIDVKPRGTIFKLLAGTDGEIQMEENNLSIVSGNVKIILHLNLKKSNIFVEAGEKVQKTKILGKTKAGIILSVEKNGKLIPVCLTIKDDDNVIYTKEYSDSDPCENKSIN